jgi:hypothetical protein
MDEFIDWYCSEPRLALNRGVVLRYRMRLETQKLAPATINVRLTAVRRLVYEAADTGLLSSELVAGVRRVKGVPQLGRRVGNRPPPPRVKSSCLGSIGRPFGESVTPR